MPDKWPITVEDLWTGEDACLVLQMNRPHFFDRFDWLRRLDDVSEQNRQQTLEWLVKARLRDDSQPPCWIFLAIDFAEKYGWPVPEAWTDLLTTSVHLYKIWGHPYNHREICFGSFAAEWLEKRQSPKPEEN